MIEDVLATVVIKKQRQAKGLRLRVQDDGRVTLTVPRFFSLKAAKQFLLTKQEWIAAARQRMKNIPPRLLNQGDEAEYQVYKEQARERIQKRVAYFQKHYGVTGSGLSIRNQRSRFGSCSSWGHLSFNYRLIFLPPTLFDYVVVHEVCHLRELNHSSRFWSLVAETIPDYRDRKKQLQSFSRPSS